MLEDAVHRFQQCSPAVSDMDAKKPLLEPAAAAAAGATAAGAPAAGAADDEDADDGHEYDRSILILTLVMVADAIEYGVLMPSLYLYLQEILGYADTKVYGLVLAAFSAASLCAKPVLGAWCDRSSFRAVYVASIATAIAGNLMYAVAGHWHSLALALGGRVLSGVGCANTSLVYAYVARTLPKRRLSGVMMKVGLVFPIGLVLGPCTNLITAHASFRVGSFAVTDTNAPGLLVALVLALLLCAIVLQVREPPPYAAELAHPAAASDKGRLLDGARRSCAALGSELRRPSVALCFAVIFAFNLFINASEAVVVPVTQHAFGFSPLQNSLVYAGMAATMIVVTGLLIRFGGGVSDRAKVLAACALYAAGNLAVCFLWTYDMPLWKFVLGEAALLLSIPFTFAPNRAIFSKLVAGSPHQALLSSSLSIMSSVGSICGPLWISATFSPPDGDSSDGPVARSMFFGLLGLAAATGLAVYAVWFKGGDPALLPASSAAKKVAAAGPDLLAEGDD